ncbi:MAG TPA: alpha/beta hydrolase [Bacteroidia bacterium]|nr:alpha/beta hydrolase [Bacteroidia bacterium]
MEKTPNKFIIYCIPGLGTNQSLFKKLQLINAELVHIQWLKPLKKETLPEYALRLAEQIDQTQPFILMGVSFGGMCAIEIAKKLTPLKTILISSSKTATELPWNFELLKIVPVYKLLTEKISIAGARLFKKRIGVTPEIENDFSMLLTLPPEHYYRRTIDMIVHWENKQVPANCMHIHGTADRVLPLKKEVDYNQIIKNGSHLMILDRAGDISGIINRELQCLFAHHVFSSH